MKRYNFMAILTLWYYEKRFYTRETLRGIRISRLAKIPTLIVIYWYHWIKKRINYLSCIEGKRGGVWKTFTVLHKMQRYLLIYYKISFILCVSNSIWSKYCMFCDSNYMFIFYTLYLALCKTVNCEIDRSIDRSIDL